MIGWRSSMDVKGRRELCLDFHSSQFSGAIRQKHFPMLVKTLWIFFMAAWHFIMDLGSISLLLGVFITWDPPPAPPPRKPLAISIFEYKAFPSFWIIYLRGESQMGPFKGNAHKHLKTICQTVFQKNCTSFLIDTLCCQHTGMPGHQALTSIVGWIHCLSDKWIVPLFSLHFFDY